MAGALLAYKTQQESAAPHCASSQALMFQKEPCDGFKAIDIPSVEGSSLFKCKLPHRNDQGMLPERWACLLLGNNFLKEWKKKAIALWSQRVKSWSPSSIFCQASKWRLFHHRYAEQTQLNPSHLQREGSTWALKLQHHWCNFRAETKVLRC